MTRDQPAELPLDPAPADVGPRPRFRPVHARPLMWAAVAAGGAAGTAVRALTSGALPHPAGGWPLDTFTVNVAGSFLLGVLLEALIRGGPDAGWRRTARLAAGTGFCGSLTTYSSLAVEAVLLAMRGQGSLAAGYAVASVLTGLVAVTTGIVAAAGWHRGRRRRGAVAAAVRGPGVR